MRCLFVSHAPPYRAASRLPRKYLSGCGKICILRRGGALAARQHITCKHKQRW